MSIGSDRGASDQGVDRGASDRVNVDVGSLFDDWKNLPSSRDSDALTATSLTAFSSLNAGDGQKSGNSRGPTAAEVTSDTLENGYKDMTARMWGDGFAGSNSILAQSDSSSTDSSHHETKKERSENDRDNKERGMASAMFLGLASAEMNQSPEAREAGEQALKALEARARESLQAPLQGVGNTFVTHSDNQAALAKLRKQGFAI